MHDLKNKSKSNIYKSTDFGFDNYKEIVNKVHNIMGGLEEPYQNDVVRPFLNRLLKNHTDITIVDTSNSHLYRKSAKHDRAHYSAKHAASEERCANPDLLIAKDYNYCNTKPDSLVTYLAAVEIKSPLSKQQSLYGKIEYDNTDMKTKKQIMSYFNSKYIKKVILTDCLCWHFIYKDNEIPLKTITLIDKVENDKIIWNETKHTVWNELNNKIMHFLGLSS